LQLGPHVIKSAHTVKLLGLHLDRELRWHPQGAAVLAKGHAWLRQGARIARASQAIVETGRAHRARLYLAVCVPGMLYGADVFLSPPPGNRRAFLLGKKQQERGIVKTIRTIQRRAALAITGALGSTPTDVLDAHANLLPVVHVINKVRFGAAAQLATLAFLHPLYKTVREAAGSEGIDGIEIGYGG
ncbi:hypothetical protein C8R46DRAFT_906280, partial [Mycena filopes]